MTGFRNKELSEKLKKIGAIISESINKNVFVVLVKNKDEDTTKAELARENNIPIMLVDDFIKEYKLDL
jgi:NAD-dependent DNA ligase